MVIYYALTNKVENLSTQISNNFNAAPVFYIAEEENVVNAGTCKRNLYIVT